MNQMIRERARELGLQDGRHDFRFGHRGFEIGAADIAQLEQIARAAVEFIGAADEWYRAEVDKASRGGSQWLSILRSGIPASYWPATMQEGQMSQALMIDTVWTGEGWRIVEIDFANRNGLGFPLMLRELGGLPALWPGTAVAWRDAGFSGAVQIMADKCRFYEPYYRLFQTAIGGVIVPETELVERIGEVEQAPSLVDLPILHPNRFIGQPVLDRLLAVAARVPVGVPPKHHLSSKAVLSLPWEIVPVVRGVAAVRQFLPETRVLNRRTELPAGPFFVKLFQSGGAKGTFHNDTAKFEEMRRQRPGAIVQRALPIAKRPVWFLDSEIERCEEKFIRFSLYVAPNGRIVDADVTASDETIVHGGRNSIMTVPVMQ